MGTPKDSELTRARIIAAAGELFAEHGYHGVTVREIIRKAETHLSALNYHFAGKEGLYREVLTHACESPESAQLNLNELDQMEPCLALVEVVRAWVGDYTAGETGIWKAKLIDRECLEPSPAFQELVADKIMPDFRLVMALLCRATGHAIDSKEVQGAVLGLVGQVTTLSLYRRLLETVSGGLYESLHTGDWLVRALVDSALAFVRSVPSEETGL